MKKHVLLGLALGAVGVSVSLPAAAEFGKPGQLAISNDMTLDSVSFTSTSTSPPQGDSTTTTRIRLAPGADYFVIPNLSVGGSIEFSTLSGGKAPADFSQTTFGIGPRVGYNLGFTPQLSFWPRLAFTFESTSRSTGGTTNATRT